MDENLENSELVMSLPHVCPDQSISSIMQGTTRVSSIDWRQDGSMFITSATDGM